VGADILSLVIATETIHWRVCNRTQSRFIITAIQLPKSANSDQQTHKIGAFARSSIVADTQSPNCLGKTQSRKEKKKAKKKEKNTERQREEVMKY
jgi:hypothetical protein